jgi:hypothetical protein
MEKSNIESADLQRQITSIVHTWTAHNDKTVTEKLLEFPSIKFVTSVSTDLVCFDYAILKILHLDSIWNRSCNFNSQKLKALIEEKFLEETSTPSKGDLALYSSWGDFIHAGIYCNGSTIESKWGKLFGILQHEAFSVPLAYGNNVKYFRPTDINALIEKVIELTQNDIKRGDEAIKEAALENDLYISAYYITTSKYDFSVTYEKAIEAINSLHKFVALLKSTHH